MAQPKPPRPRPTSSSKQVILQTVAATSPITAGYSTAVNLLPESGGNPLHYIMAILLGGIITFCLICAWHVLIAYAVHAREPHERGLAVGGGIILTSIAAGCSVWFLVASIGGPAALRMHRAQFNDGLDGASRLIGKNTSAQIQLTGAVCSARDNLLNLSNAEGGGRNIGKKGRGPLWASYLRAGEHFAAKCEELKKNDELRSVYMTQGLTALNAARGYNTSGNEKAYADAITRASDQFSFAARIQPNVGDLGVGLGAVAEAKKHIDNIIKNIGDLVDRISTVYVSVTVPYYSPIDARQAVVDYPQPLPWIAACVVELFGMICLALALTIWRDPPENDVSDGGAYARELPLDPRPLPRPSIVAAE